MSLCAQATRAVHRVLWRCEVCGRCMAEPYQQHRCGKVYRKHFHRRDGITFERVEVEMEAMRMVGEGIVAPREGDAGYDLMAAGDMVLQGQAGQWVPTGVWVAIPPGHVGLIRDRSSMASRGIAVLAGVVDSGYRGEVKVLLWNLTKGRQLLRCGERIAQLLVVPVAMPALVQVESLMALGETERGPAGFGSTGR